MSAYEDFWTPSEWAEWSNELAMLFDEDEPTTNPEGAQESILLDVFGRWANERTALRALLSEYHATGHQSAAYTQERALVERLDAILNGADS